MRDRRKATKPLTLVSKLALLTIAIPRVSVLDQQFYVVTKTGDVALLVFAGNKQASHADDLQIAFTDGYEL